jgi:hypothetical protein
MMSVFLVAAHMQAETQNQPLTVPGIAVNGESEQSKGTKRGGKRSGAGRKPNLAKRLLKGFSRNTIADAAANVDVGAVVTSLLKSKREKTRLETLIFVKDDHRASLAECEPFWRLG